MKTEQLEQATESPPGMWLYIKSGQETIYQSAQSDEEYRPTGIGIRYQDSDPYIKRN